MEFEMTRPMLDFVIRLHKNGENPYDKGSKKRDARYRIKDKKFLLVDIKVRTTLQSKGPYIKDVRTEGGGGLRIARFCRQIVLIGCVKCGRRGKGG